MQKEQFTILFNITSNIQSMFKNVNIILLKDFKYIAKLKEVFFNKIKL